MSDDLKQEITELEGQLVGEETTTEEAPATEEPKDISTDNVVEKDGEIYLKDNSADEKTEDTSVEQPAEEPKTETTTEDPYKDKSKEDLIEMLNAKQEAPSTDTEKQADQKPVDQMSQKELLGKLSANDIVNGLSVEKQKLSDMSPLDNQAAYDNQIKLVNQLEVDLVDKRTQEALQSRFNNSENKEYISNYKDVLKGNGIDLSEGDYSKLVQHADSYKVKGKYNDAGMHKAMIDMFGPEQLLTYFTSKGEGKARDDIANAASKTHPKVDVSGSGKNAKLVRLNDMAPREMSKQLDNLSVAELKALNRKLN